MMVGSATALMAAIFVLAPAHAEDKPVEKNGQHAELKLEQVLSGYLKELNGKYKIRVSEVTYAAGGFIGPHHHTGPGIRCLTAGELSYEQPDRTTIYKKGDCFYESGDVSHTAHNLTKEPAILLNFEILPASWAGSSSIPCLPQSDVGR